MIKKVNLSQCSASFVLLSTLVIIAGLAPPQIVGHVLIKFDVIQIYILDIVFMMIAILLLCISFFSGALNKLHLTWFFMLLSLVFSMVYTMNSDNNGHVIALLRFSLLMSLPLIKIRCNEVKLFSKLLALIIGANILFGVMVWLLGAVLVSLISTNAHGSVITPFGIVGGQISLAYLSGLLIALLSMNNSINDSMKWLLMMVLIFLLLFVFDSRTGLLIGLSALFGHYIFSSKGISKYFSVIFIMIAVVGGIVFLSDNSSHRITQVDFSDNSSSLRLNAAIYALTEFSRSPFFGHGIGEVFPYIDKTLIYDELTSSGNYVFIRNGLQVPTEPHSSVLLFLIDFGAIAFIFLFTYLIALISRISKATKVDPRIGSFRMYIIAIALIAGFTSSFIMNDVRLSIIIFSSIVLFNSSRINKVI